MEMNSEGSVRIPADRRREGGGGVGTGVAAYLLLHLLLLIWNNITIVFTNMCGNFQSKFARGNRIVNKLI